MADPLTVPCPDCAVPEGTPCATSIGYLEGAHAERQRVADLRAVEHGTCALCSRPMVRGSIEGRPVDAWHPDPQDAAACPPIPDARTDYNGYATAINAGLEPGHPGAEHFIPDCTCEGVTIRTDYGTGTEHDVDRGNCPVHQDLTDEDYADLLEQGRALASQREDLIAAGADPADLSVPLSVSMIVCPECSAGKHPNCDGTAWDQAADQPTTCDCATADHPGALQ